MKIKTFLLALLICTTSIIFAQTDPQKVIVPATMLMSEAPAQIEITFINGGELRARKIADLSNLDFKSITSFICYYPDENSDNSKFNTLLDSLLNASPNLEVLKFSYGDMETLPEINNVNLNLKKLDLSHNNLKSLPVGLNKFPKLEQLNLEDNDLKNLPVNLASLINLKYLNFSLNSIDKELFMKSVLTLKFKGILRLSRVGLTEADYEKIRGKLKGIEIYQWTSKKFDSFGANRRLEIYGQSVMEKIEIKNDFDSHILAMDDFELSLKLANAVVKIIYVSEPPHGDSYHHLFIDDRKFPGYLWGCHFLFPYHQKYIICSWMKDLYERKTIIIEIETLKYRILKKYYGQFKMKNHQIQLIGTEENENLLLDLSAIENLFSTQS